MAWGYQLQGARAEFVPPAIDLLVIDHAREQSSTDLLTPPDVQAFRTRSTGAPRVVLAYMSVGEAEKYRYYWRNSWVTKAWLGLLKPSWLARENKEWKGNYLVRFWDAGWQKLIFNPAPTLLDNIRLKWLGASEPYIDKIIDAGFDGVYLDRVDVFGEWEKSHPSAEADMSAFVERLSKYAKSRKPGFLIVPQNGEELLTRADYRGAVDGIAKEDLLFGVEKSEKANDRDETKRSVELLKQFQADGKPVFVVEYLQDQSKRAISRARMKDLGFGIAFAERDLNRPPELEQVPTAPTVAAPPKAAITTAPAIPKPQP